MDNLTPEQRKKNMKSIRSKNTRPELAVTKELRRRHIYFSVHSKTVFGKPDILFLRKKIAVFIDSDFWHGNPGYFKMPKSNVRYWKEKIARNRSRDKEVTRNLRKSGWTVIRIWEHSVYKNFPKSIARVVKCLE